MQVVRTENGCTAEIRCLLPLDQRKLNYNAKVKQTKLYASTVWTSYSAENILKVFWLQKHTAGC